VVVEWAFLVYVEVQWCDLVDEEVGWAFQGEHMYEEVW
jgi:hypothetical protein